jgi:hypothetical protein
VKKQSNTASDVYKNETIRSLTESLKSILTDGERYHQEHRNAQAIHSAADIARWDRLKDDNAHRETMVRDTLEELRELKVQVQDRTNELRTDELDSMTWAEFTTLLGNLGADADRVEEQVVVRVVAMDARTWENIKGVAKGSQLLKVYHRTISDGFVSSAGENPTKDEAPALEHILEDAMAMESTKTARRWFQERGNVWATPFSKTGRCQVEHLFRENGKDTLCDKHHGGHVSTHWTDQELKDLEGFQRPALCKACLRKLAKTDPSRAISLTAMGYDW